MTKPSLFAETKDFAGSLISRTWNSAKNTVHSAWTGTSKSIQSITSNIWSLLWSALALAVPPLAIAIPVTYATVKTAQAALIDILWNGDVDAAKRHVKEWFTDPYHVIKKGVKGTLAAVGWVAKWGATIVAAPFAALGDSLWTNQDKTSQQLRHRSKWKWKVTPPEPTTPVDNEAQETA